jgi:hypothetical protein
MDADLNKNFEKVFKSIQEPLGIHAQLSLIVIATFVIDDKGIPTVEEMCVMLTSPEWLPLDNQFEQQLVERLSRRSAAFRNNFATTSLPISLSRRRS